jgi:hypothetical protein
MNSAHDTTMTTAYVYDETTNKCLFIVTGSPESVEWEIAGHFEQNGTPATFIPSQLTGIESAEVLSV